ncbi:MAG: MOSC N-terminal beta barrel domain-containing protein [Opitutae bacterium]|nr:MOSC N-terminal beta barrel domain-containing protein [Opitutae bacterium]
MLRVSGLFIYPVKSCRGLSLDVANVDELGLVGDRRFLVVDETGKFLTQRTHARMAQIATALDAERLTLSAQGAGSVSIARAPDPGAPLRGVTVWKHNDLQAEDCGPEAAQWLSGFLGARLSLVRIGPAFERNVLKKAGRPGDVFNFADAVPVLIAGEASLADLNDCIQENGGEPVPMDRFRPNIVVSGGAPFAEDDWPTARIGDVVLRNAGKSIRCIVTTTDQLTGERGKEPLRTLATYRRDATDPTGVCFGTNFINETKCGVLRVGAEVVVGGGAV